MVIQHTMMVAGDIYAMSIELNIYNSSTYKK